MSKKENAAQYGNTGRQREQATGCAANIPTVNFTHRQMNLQEFLPRSRAAAMTATELAKAMGAEKRQITKEIQRLRLAGVPVCAASGDALGYWISEDPAEVVRYCKNLDGRLRNIRLTREAIESALTGMTGQLKLTGVEVQHEQKEDAISKETL